MFIEEMKRRTKKTGKNDWTASPEPVRSARNEPNAPNPSATSAAKASSTGTPAHPAAKSTPNATPTVR